MNIAQRIVFVVGIVVFLLLGVDFVTRTKPSGGGYGPAHYHWFMHGPKELVAGWVMVVVATAGSIFLFKSGPKGDA